MTTDRAHQMFDAVASPTQSLNDRARFLDTSVATERRVDFNPRTGIVWIEIHTTVVKVRASEYHAR